MRRAAALSLVVLAALAVAPSAASGQDRFTCAMVSETRCTPGGGCRVVPADDQRKAIVFALDFVAKTLQIRHPARGAATVEIYREWREGAKRLFLTKRADAPAPPTDPRPNVLEGATLTIPADLSESSMTLACAPASSRAP